jgi:hypothetical protein
VRSLLASSLRAEANNLPSARRPRSGLISWTIVAPHRFRLPTPNTPLTQLPCAIVLLMSSPERSDPQFEVFRKGSGPRTTQPRMTIQKGGTFSLNRAAYSALGGPEAVELLYDPASRIIGLRRASALERHAFPIRAVGRGNTFALSGRAFCTYYGIPTAEARRFYARPLGDVLTVDLAEAEQPSSQM